MNPIWILTTCENSYFYGSILLPVPPDILRCWNSHNYACASSAGVRISAVSTISKMANCADIEDKSENY